MFGDVDVLRRCRLIGVVDLADIRLDLVSPLFVHRLILGIRRVRAAKAVRAIFTCCLHGPALAQQDALCLGKHGARLVDPILDVDRFLFRRGARCRNAGLDGVVVGAQRVRLLEEIAAVLDAGLARCLVHALGERLQAFERVTLIVHLLAVQKFLLIVERHPDRVRDFARRAGEVAAAGGAKRVGVLDQRLFARRRIARQPQRRIGRRIDIFVRVPVRVELRFDDVALGLPRVDGALRRFRGLGCQVYVGANVLGHAAGVDDIPVDLRPAGRRVDRVAGRVRVGLRAGARVGKLLGDDIAFLVDVVEGPVGVRVGLGGLRVGDAVGARVEAFVIVADLLRLVRVVLSQRLLIGVRGLAERAIVFS